MLNAGKLQKRIRFKRRSGNELVDAGIEAWASVEPISGRELLTAVQVQASITHRVRMWYQPGITPDMLIDYNGRLMGISSIINPNDNNTELELLAEELVKQPN